MPISDSAVEAIGGAIGSCIAIGATYPLTNISTWQALQHSSDYDGTEEERTLEAVLRHKYRFIPAPIKDLLVYSQTKGWGALYAGIKPCLVATGASQGVYFYLYSAIRQAVVARQMAKRAQLGAVSAVGDSRTTDIGVSGSLFVAAAAGAINVLITNPMWIIATQMQALQKSPDPEQRQKSMLEVTLDLFRDEGLSAFWKGLTPALVMVMNPTLQYMLYESMTARVLRSRRERRLNKATMAATQSSSINPAYAREAARDVISATRDPVALTSRDAFMLSAMAKLLATLVTYPAIVIKSRMQAVNASTAAEVRYVGVVDAVARIIGAEGVAGLFKGLRAKLVQTVLGAALLMAIKEEVVSTTRSALKASQSVAAKAPAMVAR